MSNEIRLMDLAQRAKDTIPIVHGIATARLSHNEVDAALLITRYFEDAIKDGIDVGSAWSTLFSSTMLVLGDALEVGAQQADCEPEAILTNMALVYQLGQS